MPASPATRPPLPRHPQAAAVLARGRTALEAGRFDDAIRCFRKAVALGPRNSAVHYALGIACIKANRANEAIAPMLSARDLAPEDYECQMGLADAYYLSRQPAHALAEYLRAGAMKPHEASPWSNAGALYRELGRPELALEALHRALTVDPGHASALCNSALAFHDLGEFAIARDSVDLALQSRPDYREAHWNRAILDLLHGNFSRGWSGHEYRTVQLGKLGTLREMPQKRWHGERFDGKRLLLWPEQGLGDQLQFIRFLPRVKALGGTVILACSAPLQQVLRDNCPDADDVIVFGAPHEAVDLQLPLLSLPHVLQLGDELDASRVPYVQPSGRAAPALAAVLPFTAQKSPRKLRVGVCWAGQPRHLNDHNRSLTLETLRPLFQVPSVEWYSLQKGEAAEAQLGPFNERSLNLDLPCITPLGAMLSDFSDTAHAVARMDVVLSVDTSVAHLAGAMNVPTFMLIPFVPDWRWQVNRSDSPWYPNIRLFRQPNAKDWSSVVASVANALACLDIQAAHAATATRSLAPSIVDAVPATPNHAATNAA